MKECPRCGIKHNCKIDEELCKYCFLEVYILTDKTREAIYMDIEEYNKRRKINELV